MNWICEQCGHTHEAKRNVNRARSAGSQQRVVRRLNDGDDMLKDSLEQEGKEIGITVNAAGTGILLQLGEVPTCHKCELHQIRVTLNREESLALRHKLDRLIACLPEPPNAEVRDRRPSASDLSATANGGSLH